MPHLITQYQVVHIHQEVGGRERVGNVMFAIKTKLITSLGTTKKTYKKIRTHHQAYL
jgi:hypothetical protein